jgi:hypothetical protein
MTMSHFFVIPANENGIVLDAYLLDDLSTALSAPFSFSDVFVYSHGWWTDASRAMQDYNRFTIGLAKQVQAIAASGALSASGPIAALGVGVHWPSMLSDDSGSLINNLEVASFYTMEKRADNIGENAGYTILRALFQSGGPRRINLVGHSFGCKVILSLLQEIAQDGIQCPSNVSLNVVLLQAATDDNHLEAGDAYGLVSSSFPALRLLLTVSQADLALKTAYPAAHVVNYFSGHQDRQALGFAGPTQAVVNQFGGYLAIININPGFSRQTVVNLAGNRLIQADLTGIHRDPANPYKADLFSGHHSDIFRGEVYDMIAGFVYGV